MKNSYYRAVLKEHNKILRFLLILLLMITPMRGLLAAQLTHCNMQDMNSALSSELVHDMSSHDMTGHDMSGHDMSDHDMSHYYSSADDDMVMPDADQQHSVNNKCCCCDDGCNSQCDMGLSVVLILQVSDYMPVFVNAANSISVSPQVLVRALTPPSRPPAQLS